MPERAIRASTSNRVDEIAQLLFGATEQMRQSFERICARLDLTPAQGRAMLALKEKAPMRSLAKVLSCDASNVTGITDRLEQRGLVRRESAMGDRRVKLLVLTSKGKRVRGQVETLIEAHSPVTTGLSPMERETLRELLAKLAARTNSRAFGDPSQSMETHIIPASTKETDEVGSQVTT